MPESQPPARQPARDVLAAEAFAVPAPDPSLRHRPVVLPEDPTGIAEPHDILAAEEFAMPAARSSRSVGALARPGETSWRLEVGIALALVALLLLRRLFRAS